MKAVLYFLLAILEGALAGGYFCCAGQEKKKERKALLYVISALWFLSSLLSFIVGGSEWKKRGEAKAFELIEGEEGEYEDE